MCLLRHAFRHALLEMEGMEHDLCRRSQQWQLLADYPATAGESSTLEDGWVDQFTEEALCSMNPWCGSGECQGANLMCHLIWHAYIITAKEKAYQRERNAAR